MNAYDDQIDMLALLANIAPLPRTLACNATDTALQHLAGYLPGGVIDGFPTGTKAWSWTIPSRWELKGATIKSNGETLVDAAWSALHVVNYSQPFKGTVTRSELLKHISTYPGRPDAIPFSFSFFEPVWGFSMPHSWLDRFTSDTYEVEIDSRYESGNLNTLSWHIPGDLPQTFVICSNICHPLQANDSLTGVAVAIDIAKRLADRANRKYSYLVMVVPETIGSIAFMANRPHWQELAIGGLFSEMLGTSGALVGQRTRREDSYWNRLLENVLTNSGLPHKIVGFMKSASNDEKVLDSPGVDIPTFSITRYPYPEYHTSDDNIDLIDINRLREGRDVLQQIIDFAEKDYIPVLKQPGPIFLSGHGLYPNWREDPSLVSRWEAFVDVMYSIDGIHSVVELATAKKIPLDDFFYWTDAFAHKGLLERRAFAIERK